MTFKPTSVPTKNLLVSITSGSLSFRLNNIKAWNGVNLTAADFGTQGYVVFRDAARTKLEIMEFDPSTIASNDIVITKRGLQFDGNLLIEDAARKLSWTKGDTFVDLGTDVPQLWQWLKEYVDAVSIAGAPDSSTSTKGIVKMSSTPSDPANPIAFNAEDAKVAAMAGGGAFGTPGSGNKFITEDKMENAATLSLTRSIATGSSTKNAADATGTQTIAHGLGKVPTRILMKASASSATDVTCASQGEWRVGGFYNAIAQQFVEGSGSAQADTFEVSTSYILCLFSTSTSGSTNRNVATIAVDDTNITITWTKTSSPGGTYNFVWLAETESVTYS